MKRSLPFVICLILFFQTNVFAQHIDSIIERSLRALGGRDKFNDLTSIYKEGFFYNKENEESVLASIKTNNLNEEYAKFVDYFIPFQGKRLEIKSNRDKKTSVSLWNTKRYWEFMKLDDSTKDGLKYKEVSIEPKYKFLSFYFITNKYSFDLDFVINNYSTEKNTSYLGYEIKEGVRCIKLGFNKTIIIYLNAETYLPYVVSQRIVEPKKKTISVIERKLEDYTKTSYGLLYPFKQTESEQGLENEFIFLIKKIDFNTISNHKDILSTTEPRLAYLKLKTINEHLEKKSFISKDLDNKNNLKSTKHSNSLSKNNQQQPSKQSINKDAEEWDEDEETNEEENTQKEKKRKKKK